jgi:NADH:ubiquinone oxidoreductase subunit 6 (subunit J)
MAIPQEIPILGWAWDDLVFLLLGGIMLAAALFVVIGRDIIRSGLAMIVAFAALAGIYVLAGAVIVAAAQVLIYIGAISVLILFAIMLTQTKAGPASLRFHHQAWVGLLVAIVLAFLTIGAIIGTAWPGKEAQRIPYGTIEIAHLLFAPLYVLSLQVVAVMLTAAVIGGVFLAKREDAPDPGEREGSTLERLGRGPVASDRRDAPATAQADGFARSDAEGERGAEL